MAPHEVHVTTPTEDEEFLFAMEIASISALPFVLKTLIDLGVIDALAKTGSLSPSDIACLISSTNPSAPSIIDRMLRLLASYCILSCEIVEGEDGGLQALYSLGPKGKFFVNDTAGSAAPMLLYLQNKRIVDSWSYLKDVVMEGGEVAFNRANGVGLFDYTGKDKEFGDVFNRAMQGPTAVSMRKILERYGGFDGVKTLVDVGGGIGSSLRVILSKYPNIKGVNYDLPHVVKEAPPHPGLEHVGGNMFETVPSGDVILLKWVICDLNDDDCTKLLKNCWRALPEKGKVVVIDTIVPEHPNTDIVSRNTFLPDLFMLNVTPSRGRDRKLKEFEGMSDEIGFHRPEFAWRAYNTWVIELKKKIC